MKRLIVLLIALLSVGAQESPYDADGHLKTEHQIPAGHSCMQRQVFDENAKRLAATGRRPSVALHPCDCAFACHVDANGNVSETGGEKTPTCAAYCSKDGRRCGCHPEPFCDPGAHAALMDMNGTVIAVKVRH